MPAPDCAASPLTICLFGPFEVRLDGVLFPRPRTRKAQWLLALLALRRGMETDRAWLAGLLWPESSEALAFTSLRSSLADLRQVLGPEAARLRSPSLRTLALDLTGAQVDVLAFDGAIGRGDPPSLEEAVLLYRGPLLEECAEAWVLPERQAREQAYLQALERLAAGALASGAAAAAERHLRAAVGVDPLRETAQRALMQALAAGGNHAAALVAYRDLRLLLHRELNAAPDAETEALFRQIREEARRRAEAPRPTPASGPASSPGRSMPLLLSGEGTLTFLFTDIEGSTRLWEEQPEAMRDALAHLDALLRPAVEISGGHLFKRYGDAFCAAFATAPDALAAALSAHRALHGAGSHRAGARPAAGEHSLEMSPRVRMALHTGAVEEREGDYAGPALSRAARLLEAGHGGQILLSRAAQELARDELPDGTSLRDLGEHRLQDLVQPERVFQLVSRELPADFPPLRALDARPNNLPVQPTPLLGRDREVGAVRELLRRAEVRQVTLTGPAGTGKTRLALQVAADLLDDFPDGVFFVPLAPIRDPGLVLATIAQTLRVRESGGRPLLEGLNRYLQEKRLLLLLDNVEQVIAAAPQVSELLAVAPRLKVLVTSRAVLRLRGEKEFPVPPLAVPDLQRLPPAESLSQYAAVELCVQRARDVRPEFAVTHENGPAVAAICHRLDGLPLAIELAAARIKLLPPQALLARLDRRLPLLTGGARDLPARQQTLRGAIAWSYDLLGEGEKAVFRRLSVFAGGCTLEAAERVAALPIAGRSGQEPSAAGVLDALASLVDENLLRREEPPTGEPRFGMLETIREYGRECLEASGEAEALLRRHRDWCLELAEQAEAAWGKAAQGEWLERLEREHDNLRAALEWSVEKGDAEEGLRLGGALCRFWSVRGYLAEGRERLTRLLALAGTAARTAARAKVLHGLGNIALHQGDYDAARALYEESLAIKDELGDRPGVAASLNNLGIVAYEQGDDTVARSLHGESLAIQRALGDRWGIANSLNNLGEVALRQNDHAGAQALYEESLVVRRELDDKRGIAIALVNLGRVRQKQGDEAQARALYRESLALYQEVGDKSGTAACVEGLAGLAGARGQPERAAQVFGAAAALRGAIGAPLPSADRADYERQVAAVRADLDEAAFTAAWAAGRAMSLEDAIRFALEEPQGGN